MYIEEAIFAADDGLTGFNPNFLNTPAGYKLMYERVQAWADLICRCLSNFEYLNVDFNFRRQYNFNDGIRGNQDWEFKKRSFTIRKTFNGKCIIELNDFKNSGVSGLINDGGVLSGDSDVPSAKILNVISEASASVSAVKYFRLPAFTSSAYVEEYYKLETNSTSSMRIPGLLYFNQSDSNVYVYNGETWSSVGGQSELSRFTQSVGDGTASMFVVTHSKNTRDVMVTVRETNPPYDVVYPDVNMTSANTVRVDFSPTIPSSNQYTIVII